MTDRNARCVAPDEVPLDAVASALCRLFDFLPHVQFWVKDRAGCYRWVNRAFLLNYSLERPEQVLGRTDYDLSPAHLADQFRLDDEQVLAGREILSRVELVGRFDHTASWCVTSKIPIRVGRRIVATSGITYPLQAEAADHSWPNLALGRVIAYIRQHCGDGLSNPDLAGVAGLSVRAFERQFRRFFHRSPQQYVKRVRVRTACYALVRSGLPLVEIAQAHGFADQSHFAREFRREVGMTPSDYRRKYAARSG
jgi:AraC-like DNA-binding protein